ncbi:MAG: GTP-binding protein, partial [Calditrichaeota bacterium]|nr:GTP-binding protein [Calditrichota bacterium]
MPEFLGNLHFVRYFSVEKNPLNQPPFEVAMHGIPALRRYYEDLKAGVVRNYEAKLILIGNGRVGKTSLSKALLGEPFDPEEPSTHAIRVVPQDIHAKGYTVKAKLWDFGGQEIYHATHSFFLSTRALYLLVWSAAPPEKTDDAADEADFPYEYWLEHVRTLGGNSPVILVQNKTDLKREFLDQGKLAERYDNIREFCDVSASAGDGVEHLKEQIRKWFAADPQLKHIIGFPMPEAWERVRRALEKKAEDEPHITYQAYLDLCRAEQLPEESAPVLCRFLHETGVLLHFADMHSLRSMVIIDPNWAIEQVYAILNRPELLRGRGRFGRELLRQVLADFSEPEIDRFLDLLQRFELVFPLDAAKQQYVAPQYLSPETPEGFGLMWEHSGPPVLVYHYPRFLHKNIMVRFLSRFGAQAAQQVFWKHGIIIKKGPQRALVQADEAQRQISVSLEGHPAGELLREIFRSFKEIHERMEVEARVVCPCTENRERRPPHGHSLEDLLASYQKGGGRLQCRRCFREVEVRPLLEPLLEPREKLLQRMREAGGEIPALDARTAAEALLPAGKSRTPKPIPAEDKPEIYLSYGWEPESQKLAAKLEEAFRQKALLLRRDSSEVKYKDSIREFMKRIGRSRY